MTIASLTPSITRILTAPGVDLASISAKAVRRQLLAADDSLDEEWVRAHKHEIDAVIAQVFHNINSGNAPSSEPEPRPKSESPAPALALPPPSAAKVTKAPKAEPSKPKKLSPPAPSSHLSDAQIARQLSAELNTRPTRSASTGASSSAGSKRKRADTKTKKKSKAEIDSEDDDAAEQGEKPKKKARGGFAKEYILSDALASVAGVPTLSRPQVVKSLWDYIKGNNLQNPTDKREIICDDKLKALFGVAKVNMFTMNKLVGNHLSLPEETS
ncbi:hypothetical protein BOTBODRAFT_51325 [Botryobasidium botryosum FD-172 SS1]|uniref:DM2 domain-containing protein n=1 Tax=Botryobasidium botryosum (strain FD-172 SS1) TaxID=930990 RepID=A0A067N758_BOTB1|nr:hypothetical protein BOTBODRAFT_51325 [Botryobasidium botryosum FD-172 SS1]